MPIPLTSSAHAPERPDSDVPLVVDLDGSLLRVVSLKLMLRRMAVRCPHRVPMAFPLKRRGGKPAFKMFALRHSRLSADVLPRRAELLEWLEEQAETGRRIYLATGSPQELAGAVAAAHPCFEGIFATSPVTNMTGAMKAQVLCDAFGEGGFDYVGDSWADLEVWRRARRAIVCGTGARLSDAVAAVSEIDREFR